jgi:hypothetical protein
VSRARRACYPLVANSHVFTFFVMVMYLMFWSASFACPLDPVEAANFCRNQLGLMQVEECYTWWQLFITTLEVLPKPTRGRESVVSREAAMKWRSAGAREKVNERVTSNATMAEIDETMKSHNQVQNRDKFLSMLYNQTQIHQFSKPPPAGRPARTLLSSDAVSDQIQDMTGADDGTWRLVWILTLAIVITGLLVCLAVALRVCYVRSINFRRWHRRFFQGQALNPPVQLPNPAPPQPVQQVNLQIRGAPVIRVGDQAEINTDLVSYLKARVCFRERNLETLHSLVSASRVWQHTNQITDESFVLIQGPSIAKAFALGVSESWAVNFLNSDKVRAALYTYRGGMLDAGLKSYGWRSWLEILFGVGCCRSPVRLQKAT